MSVMRKKLARAGAAVSRRETKLERSSWVVVSQLHIDRERRLGAKSARIPSVARIGPRATRLGEELEPVFSFAASVIEAAGPCLPNVWPPEVR